MGFAAEEPAFRVAAGCWPFFLFVQGALVEPLAELVVGFSGLLEFEPELVRRVSVTSAANHVGSGSAR